MYIDEEKYERQYAADIRHEATIEAAADAMLEDFFGAEYLQRVTNNDEVRVLRLRFVRLARVAFTVIQRYQ